MAEPRISDEAVREKTGKDWKTWFTILDERGAVLMKHPQIVALLEEFPEVSPWWRQSITVGYEQARGLRKVHEVTGGYQISRSKTFPLSAPKIFSWLSNEDRRKRWLGEPVTFSSQTPAKSLRGMWTDGSRIDIEIMAKTPDRASVTVNHNKISTEEQAAVMKQFWLDALLRLEKEILKGE